VPTMAKTHSQTITNVTDPAFLDALQALGHGGVIFDADDRLVACNQAYRQIFHAFADKLQPGIPYDELMRWAWERRQVPANEGPFEDWHSRMLREHRSFDAPVIREMADGRFVEIVKRPVSDGGVLSIVQDVTAQQRALLEERSRRVLTEDYARSMADWFWETDDEHRFLPAHFTGDRFSDTSPQFIGKTRWEATGADTEHDPYWRDHRRTLEAHRPFRDFRYEFVDFEGKARRLRVSGQPIYREDGSFQGYRGIGIDESPLAEADIRATRAEIQAQEAVNSLSDGMAMHDPEGRLVLWNEAFERIYAKSPPKFRAGMTFRDMVEALANTGLTEHPGMTREEWIEFRCSQPRPNPATVERQVSGRWYQLREAATPSGALVIMMTDIDELKRQQAELLVARAGLEASVAERTRSLENALVRVRSEAEQRQETELRLSDSEQRFRTIAEGTLQGLYVQHDFKLAYANQALADLLGYDSVCEVMQLDDIRGFLSPVVHDELLARNKARMAGEPQPERYQSIFRKKDGTEFWVELFVSEIPWNGNPSVLVSVVDIDSQKRTIDALAAAERDYRALFEHASDGIYRSTLDGWNLRANPALAKMNGFEREEEVQGLRVDPEGSWYVKPGRRQEFLEVLLRDGRVENFVSEIHRYKTREKIWISENARLVHDEEGQPKYIEGTIRDITEQRQAEMELRQAIEEAERANYAKSQFLAKMSHELRTPLNAIIGFSEIICEEIMGPVGSPQYSVYAHDIRQSGEHLLSLINDLLDLSKIEAGELELDLERFDLGALIEECTGIVVTLAASREVAIARGGARNAGEILADRRSLKQVLLNLLSNAVKFNNEGGWVKIGVERRPGWCRIEVADNGVGIAQEHVAKLFQPFGQVNNQLVAEQKGTGLGLPIVKALVQLHGGEVSIRSNPGQGTTVSIDLPVDA